MFVDRAKKLLTSSGSRLTKPRLQILEILGSSTEALSPYDIQKTDTDLDIVSIYRTLELFESLGIAHKVRSLGGYVKCDLSHCEKHCCHEFQVCRNCNSYTEIHGHHEHSSDYKKFTIYQHISEQVGLCSKCMK